MKNEKIFYRRKDIIKILADLNVMVVSLDRIGSYYSECGNIEEYHALSSNFLDEWKILPKLTNARKILNSAFSSEFGDDDMDELEREFQGLQYWSMKNPKPLKKGKFKS